MEIVLRNRRHQLKLTARTCCFSVLMLLVGGVRGPASGQDELSAEEIGPVRVFQDEGDALREISPRADSTVRRALTVDSLVSAALREDLGREIADTTFVYYDIWRNGQLAGTAVIAEETGKYRPITFMAGIDPEFRIVDVRVLVYRESRGGEVQRKRFLKQYRGKTLASPIRINRDIINITGATISVRALNRGVRKALAVVRYLTGVRTINGEER